MTWTLTGILRDTSGAPVPDAKLSLSLARLPAVAADSVIVKPSALTTDNTGHLVDPETGAAPVFSSVPGGTWRIRVTSTKTVSIPDPGDGATLNVKDYLPQGSPVITESEAAILRAELAAAVANGLPGPAGVGWVTSNGDPNTNPPAGDPPVGTLAVDKLTGNYYQRTS